MVAYMQPTDDGWLIERDPVLHPVTKVAEQGISIVYKVAHKAPVQETTVRCLQHLRT